LSRKKHQFDVWPLGVRDSKGIWCKPQQGGNPPPKILLYYIERINTFSIQVGKGTPIQAMVGCTFIDADFGLATIYAKMSFMGNPLPTCAVN
jgi:hypothetical protein